MKKVGEKFSNLDPIIRGKIEELISIIYDAVTKDEKTGVYNYKFFENILDIEIEKFKRDKTDLSIIMLDIDYFKKINEVYGHIKADVLLEKLAKLLTKELRKSDIVSRFGGEEFLILLPSTNLEKAKRLASRLKRAIHSEKDLKKCGLTVSGGITQFKKGDNKDRLKKRVNKSLLQAKKNGRDNFMSG